jgi:hypothetical protein
MLLEVMTGKKPTDAMFNGEETCLRACLGISGMNGNEGHWGGGISTISQNFPKSTSILFHPLESSISQTSL